MRRMKYLVLLVFCYSCAEEGREDPAERFDPVAEQYVRLALALGEHDSDYVDAYFGPEEWRDAARREAMPLAEIAAAAEESARVARSVDVSGADYVVRLRQDYLATHLESIAAVARLRMGRRMTFDEESLAVYGFVAPSFPIEHYEAALAKIDALLPGDEPLHERVHDFELQFRIPPETAEAVVSAGIDACRARTLEHLELPAGESFRLEMVTGNPWGAYNWYEGDAHSLIQIETSRPITLASAIRFGCHEGYPGHHTFSSLLDYHYLQQRGWIEFSILPLFSPQGVIFEGSGNVAEHIAFPGESRDAFVRDKIMPIAGVDEADLETRAEFRDLAEEIRYAGIEAARHYLDGDWDRERTTDWLTRYALVPPYQIDAWFGFSDRYRAYLINYVVGEDLVFAFIRAENPDGDAAGDWQALAKLLSLPPAPMLFAGLEQENE